MEQGISAAETGSRRTAYTTTQSFILLKQQFKWILACGFIPTFPGHVSKINNLAKHLETLLAGVYGVLNTADSQVADFAVGGCVAALLQM